METHEKVLIGGVITAVITLCIMGFGYGYKLEKLAHDERMKMIEVCNGK